MKEFVIILMILIIIIGGDILTRNYLNKTSSKLVERLGVLKESTILAKQTEKRDEIVEEANRIEKEWKQISKIWSIIVIHQEIDNIETSFTKAKSYIEEGRLEDAVAEIETAKFFAEHVYEREKVSLKNIF